MERSRAEAGTEWLEGTITRVVWASQDTGYAVLRVQTERGEVAVVGTLASAAESEGQFVGIEGRWENHATHGHQFRAVGYLQGMPRTLEGMKLYLGSGAVAGVRKALAQRIVDRFGMETPGVIANAPHRLTEVSGINAKKAQAISELWKADEQGRALSILLRGLGLSPRLVERIRRKYGDRAAHVVEREPYRLAEEIRGIGFRTADLLARNQGLPLDHPGRARAAVLHVLDAASGEGHCYLPRAHVVRAVEALEVPTEGLGAAIDAAASDGRLVIEPAVPSDDVMVVAPPHADDRIWLTGLYNAESAVAHDLRDRIPDGIEADPAVRDDVLRAEAYEGVGLDDLQREAVERALGGGLVVITGGPGTGKTTLVRVLLRAARERGLTFKLASPTGRAAKRLEEATKAKATTIHRLLEYNPGAGGFQRGGGQPLEGDGLVVDEASMVDLPLMSALLDALPPAPFPLVLVGDADQLPSVGPGQVLRDLIDSGKVPVVRLTRIFRQGADSGIIDAAARVHAGEVPESGEVTGLQDFFLVGREEPERALEAVVSIVADRLPARGFDPHEEVQVLAPMRKGLLGTESLNAALQQRLNPHGAPLKRGRPNEDGGREFRIGDRVLCTKNRYDVEIYNGDVGRVVAVAPTGMEIEFDGRRVPWGWEDLGQIELAYAITVHKSQGSEYPAVVLVLHTSHALMLRRNLLYTGATRAKRFLCVVGSPRAWARAVQSTGGDERFTRLATRLAEPDPRLVPNAPLLWDDWGID